MINNEFKESKTKGKVKEKNILNDYLNYLKKYKGKTKKLKMVVDYSNGASIIATKKLLENTGPFVHDRNFPSLAKGFLADANSRRSLPSFIFRLMYLTNEIQHKRKF
jgi:phosphomannomutase